MVLSPRAFVMGVAGVALVACVHPVQSTAPAPAAAPAPSAEAARSFAAVETAWVNHPPMSLHMTASSTGAVVTDLQGTTMLGGDGHAELDYTGSFRGQAQHLCFAIDGTTLSGGNGQKPFTMEAPARAEHNLRVILFRLGLLHNLAMLNADQPPDGLDDANALLRLTDVSSTTDAGRPCYRYTLLIGGQQMGHGILWIDPASGLPVERQVTVHFPNGDMRVHETYILVP